MARLERRPFAVGRIPWTITFATAQLGEVVEIRPDELASMVDYFDRSYGNRTRITFDYLRRRAGA